MPTSNADRCQGKVRGDWSTYRCSNKASTEAGFCKTHDPAIQKDKMAKRDAKWEAERRVRYAADKTADENALVGAFIRRHAAAQFLQYLALDAGERRRNSANKP